ncbi:MAG: polysaccharide biosynthesis tyrosine autokinase [Solirubrobacterales bacterium]|nr:polysaccharide biosynthesis tyrosine autokinase [Solirubrobacterales bacterium]
MSSFDDQLAGGRPVAPSGTSSRSLLSVLARRAWIIAATTILLAVVAGAVTYLTRNTYSSTAELLFDQTIGPQLNALGLNPPFNNADRLAGDNVAIVGSRAVAGLAAQRLDPPSTADSVQQKVSVTGSKTSDVVSITASASSAAAASQLAGIYAHAAADLVQGNEMTRARAVLGDLSRQFAALPATDRRSAGGQQLLARIANLHAIANTGTGSPQLIQPAFVPAHKDVKLGEMIALGALFGLVLGIALALLRERVDGRLRHAEDVSAAFDAPVLATIPRNRALTRHVPFQDLPPKVVEPFFMLQSNLHYRRHGEAPRSLLVTSSRDGQGKTTVAMGLACATAAAGFRVALVDADLRRSSLAVDYSLRAFPGLSEVLREDVSAAHAIQRVPLNGGTQGENGHERGLNVLVAGSRPPDPSALIQSARMSDLLDELTRQHDVVIMDTPPIAQVADAIPLLRRVEGVLVVASVHSTRGPEAERLREHLQALDAPLLGVVANGGSSLEGEAAYARSPAYAS